MLIRLFSYMNQYKKYAVLAVVCIMTEGVFELLVPLIMADLIDVGVSSGDRAYIYMKGLQMVGCALIALVLGVGSARFAALTGQGLGAELRKAEYEKLQGYSFANIDHFRSSSLVTRLTSDVTNIQNAVSMGMRPFCRGPMMLVVATGVAFSINHTLALVFFVALPILAAALFTITMKVRPLYSRMQTAIDTVNRIIQENLTAVRIVKACVRGDYEVEKFEEGNQNLRQESETAFRLAALNMPAMQFVMYGTILAILLFGGYLIQKGSMKVGELTGFLSYVLQILNSLMMISNVFLLLTRSMASLTGFLSYVLQILNSLMMISNVFLLLTRSMASGARILEVIDEKVDLTDEKVRNIEVERGSVDFEHVWFKYKKEAKEYVLSDISFHIEAGQTVGVIGQTGAAKSTLVQLIPRLYDATEGVVKVDGVPVQEYPMAHLREAIAMVLQKNTLFSGSLLDNLRWGKEDASMEEIEEACRIACVDEVLERLPEGYETEMGQGGVNVSGGQKQRICIARALLKKPKILILDDSTSAVDTATEAKIRERMGAALPDMTKIIIGQRISSVRHADQIIILDDGRVSAIGTHEELLARSEIYQQIYESQKEGVEL